MAGGFQIMDECGYSYIGKRNYLGLRKIFWMNHVLIHSEDVGGNVNRMLSIELSSGKAWVKNSGNGIDGLKEI